MIRTRRLLLLLVAVGLTLFAVVPAGHADDREKPSPRGAKALRVPAVQGMDAGLAIERLEQMGFGAIRVITVADQRAGVVYKQIPDFNSVLAPDQEIVLLVGVESLVQTMMPDLRGVEATSVLDALEQAYVVDIREVDGRPRNAGRIVGQTPAPGTVHPMRGLIVIQVARAPLLVPRLLGLREAEARAQVEALGLLLEVTYVESGPRGAQGTVLSQNPRSGAEVLEGSVIEAQVFGRRQPPPTDLVAVPNLLGLSMSDAQELVLSLGLVPHLQLERGSAARPGIVIRQEERAGTPLRLGSHVHFTVQIGRGGGSGVRMPAFIGADLEHARQVLSTLDVALTVRQVPSAMPEGTILAQQPDAGDRLRRGTAVRLDVATRGGSDWGRGQVEVPNVVGMGLGRARASILRSGFGLRMTQREIPNGTVDRVAVQRPSAGTRAPAGTVIEIAMPLTARVPDLVGKVTARAEGLLQLAGLRGVIDGPRIVTQRSIVTAQSVPPGTAVARGSEVRMRVQASGGGSGFLVQVPSVVGQGLRDAENALLQLGLRVKTRGPQVGAGRAVVSAQSAAAGVSVPRGTEVVLTYVWQLLGPGGDTNLGRMPSVVGRTLAEARITLQQLGLQIEVVGRGARSGSARVQEQVPSAGTRVRRGTVARLTVGLPGLPGLPGQITVPNVIGQPSRQAADALAALGLAVKVEGFGSALSNQPVREQSLAPNTRVARGTEIVLRTGLAPAPGGTVVVPSLLGMSKADATRALEALGLRARVRGFDFRVGSRRPKVRQQDPAAGTRVERGSKVTIYLGF